MSATVEVRQCPRCQQPTVSLVMEWKHESLGLLAQSSKDYRCQSCGAWFIRRSRMGVLLLWIFGVLGMLGCCVGAPFLYLAWRQHTFDRRVPLVPGAPEPRLRFPGGPPKRTCGKCGGIATAVNITRHTHNGVPTGTNYDYQCGQCGLRFSTENFLGHAVSGVSGLVLGGVTAGFIIDGPSPYWRWGGGIVAGLLTVLLLGQNAGRLMNRVKHKPIEEHVL